MKIFNFKKEDIKKTLNMAVPAMLESFFTTFAGFIDSLMVSSIGAYAVAAVGLTTQPKFITLCLFVACNTAMSALVARRKGEDKRDDANRYFATYVVFMVIMSLLIGGLGVVLAGPIMKLCGSEPATHDSAVAYFRIITGGMIFSVIQMGINSVQRGFGNTKITMRTNLASSIVNVILNYLLIGGNFGFPALGIHGAAIATVAGTVVGAAMSIVSICKKDSYVSVFYLAKNKIRASFQDLRSIFNVAGGVLTENLLMRFGLLSTALMAANQGTAVMAAHQMSMNVMNLSFSFGAGLQATAIALVGYSLGAKDYEKAKDYGRTCQMVATCISLVNALLLFVGGRWICGLFFQEPEIVEVGVLILRILAVSIAFQNPTLVFMGILRGSGDTKYTAKVSGISISIIRPAVSWILCYGANLGISGVWLGMLVDQVVRFTCGGLRFKSGKWTKIKI